MSGTRRVHFSKQQQVLKLKRTGRTARGAGEPAGGGEKKVGRARARKKNWDDSVSDLSVHRLSKQEVTRRHASIQSKNAEAARHDLYEKALGTLSLDSSDNQRPSPGATSSGRMSALHRALHGKELHEVLAESDRTLAVVKDLFGDDPKRYAGLLNVTVAPHIVSSRKELERTIRESHCDGPGPTADASPGGIRDEGVQEMVPKQLAINELPLAAPPEFNLEDSSADEDATLTPTPLDHDTHTGIYQPSIDLQHFRTVISKEEQKDQTVSPILTKDAVGIRHDIGGEGSLVVAQDTQTSGGGRERGGREGRQGVAVQSQTESPDFDDASTSVSGVTELSSIPLDPDSTAERGLANHTVDSQASSVFTAQARPQATPQGTAESPDLPPSLSSHDQRASHPLQVARRMPPSQSVQTHGAREEGGAIPVADGWSMAKRTKPANQRTDHRGRDDLQVLEKLVKDLDVQLEDYEQLTGYSFPVQRPQPPQAGTFSSITASLLASVTKLAHYLKQGEAHLREEVVVRGQLLHTMAEQQNLMDALTADMVRLQEENRGLQARLDTMRRSSDEQARTVQEELSEVKKKLVTLSLPPPGCIAYPYLAPPPVPPPSLVHPPVPAPSLVHPPVPPPSLVHPPAYLAPPPVTPPSLVHPPGIGSRFPPYAYPPLPVPADSQAGTTPLNPLAYPYPRPTAAPTVHQPVTSPPPPPTATTTVGVRVTGAPPQLPTAPHLPPTTAERPAVAIRTTSDSTADVGRSQPSSTPGPIPPTSTSNLGDMLFHPTFDLSGVHFPSVPPMDSASEPTQQRVANGAQWYTNLPSITSPSGLPPSYTAPFSQTRSDMATSTMPYVMGSGSVNAGVIYAQVSPFSLSHQDEQTHYPYTSTSLPPLDSSRHVHFAPQPQVKDMTPTHTPVCLAQLPTANHGLFAHGSTPTDALTHLSSQTSLSYSRAPSIFEFGLPSLAENAPSPPPLSIALQVPMFQTATTTSTVCDTAVGSRRSVLFEAASSHLGTQIVHDKEQGGTSATPLNVPRPPLPGADLSTTSSSLPEASSVEEGQTPLKAFPPLSLPGADLSLNSSLPETDTSELPTSGIASPGILDIRSSVERMSTLAKSVLQDISHQKEQLQAQLQQSHQVPGPHAPPTTSVASESFASLRTQGGGSRTTKVVTTARSDPLLLPPHWPSPTLPPGASPSSTSAPAPPTGTVAPLPVLHRPILPNKAPLPKSFTQPIVVQGGGAVAGTVPTPPAHTQEQQIGWFSLSSHLT